MARRLAVHVHVHDEAGSPHQFGPSDEVPEWAAKLITNPDVWATPKEQPAEAVEVTAPEVEQPAGNASRDEWVAFAADKGAPVSEASDVEAGGLSRNDLRQKYGK